MLAAGGSSLSIYLGQSIVLSTIFAAYGLGLWEAVGRLSATLVAIAVAVALIAAAWRSGGDGRRWGRSEWVLRRITYSGQRD